MVFNRTAHATINITSAKLTYPPKNWPLFCVSPFSAVTFHFLEKPVEFLGKAE